MDQTLKRENSLNYSQIFHDQATGQFKIRPLIMQSQYEDLPTNNLDEPYVDINPKDKNYDNNIKIDWYVQLEKQKKQYFNDLGVSGQQKFCSWCCNSVGWNWCCSPGKLVEKMRFLGVGVNLYFRFLNSYILLSLFICLVAFILVLVNIFCYVESGQNFADGDPSLVLASTTIGFIPLSGSACQIKIYENSGVLDFNNGLKYGYISQDINQNCWILADDKIIEKSYRLDQYTEQCDSKQSCNITFYDQNKDDFKYLYISVLCKEASTEIFGTRVQNSQIPLILGYSDGVICLLIIIYLLNLEVVEGQFRRKLKSYQPQLQQFTLQISDIQSTISEETLVEELKQHFEKVMSDRNVLVYDIQVSQGLRFIEYQKMLQKCLIDIETEIQNLGLNLSIDHQFPILRIKYSQIEPFVQQIIASSRTEETSRKIQQIKSLQDKKQSIIYNLEDCRKNQDNKFIWITFQKMNDKLATQIDFTPSCLEIWCGCCFCDCCCNKYKITEFRNGKLKVNKAPNPDNIIWENLNYTKSNRRYRKIFGFILTVSTIIFSWLAIAYINTSFTHIENVYPDVDCRIYGIENDQIDNYIERYEQKEDVKNQIVCYCKENFIDVVSQQQFTKIQKVCNEQIITIVVSTSLPYLSSIIIIALNIIIDKLFQPITSFEKHQNRTEESISLTFKSFFAEFTNSALIILLKNGRVQLNVSRIDWYLNVGLTVVWTLCLNILSVPLSLLFDKMIYELRIRYDKGLFFNVDNSTKCSNYHDFLEIHKGQEFNIDQKYSKIMSSNLICFMYGPALPILYILNILTMLAMYWLDKAGLFLFYKQPHQYDKNLSIFLRKFLWFGLIVHCFFSVYFYGNPEIFREVDQLDEVIPGLKNNDFFQDYINRGTRQPQLLAILLIMLIIIIVYLLLTFIIKPTLQLFKCLKSKLENKYDKWQTSTEDTYSKNLEQFLNFSQIQQEIGVMKFVYPKRANLYHQKLQSFREIRNNLWRRLTDDSKQRIKQRIPLDNEELQKIQPSQQLSGLYSYDIMQNPGLKSYFKAEWDMLYQSNYV